MSQYQFAAMMPYITDDLAAMIANKQGLSELDAVYRLYASKLYATILSFGSTAPICSIRFSRRNSKREVSLSPTCNKA